MNYTCPRCLYSCSQKCHILKHIDKKKLCPLNNLDVDPKDYREVIIREPGSELELLKTNIQYQKEIERLKRENEKLKLITNNINVNTNNGSVYTHNGDVTLNLMAFNDPETEFLTDGDYIECINQIKARIIPRLMEKIHFNLQHPENHNMVITNMRTKSAKVFDGLQWRMYNEDELLEKLLRDREYLITDWTMGNDSEKFKKYNEKWDNFRDDLYSNKELEKRIKEEMKYVLYNNRKLFKKTI